MVLISFLSGSILKSLGYLVLQKLTSGSHSEKHWNDRVKPIRGSAEITEIPHFVREVSFSFFTPKGFNDSENNVFNIEKIESIKNIIRKCTSVIVLLLCWDNHCDTGLPPDLSNRSDFFSLLFCTARIFSTKLNRCCDFRHSYLIPISKGMHSAVHT